MAKKVASLGHRHDANDLTPFLEGTATVSGAWTFTGAVVLDRTNIDFDPSAGGEFDIRYLADSTLTALIRWNATSNYLSFQDRDPSPAEKAKYYFDTGNFQSSGYLSVQGGASDLGQVGQIAFVDIASGTSRFGSYNWDTAAYTPVQLVGSTVSLSGPVTCDDNFTANTAGKTITLGGTTTNISPSGNLNITAGGTTQCLSGGDMRCYDSSNTDYVRMVDNGSQGYVETNTNPLRIRAAASAVSTFVIHPAQSLADDAETEFTANGGVYGIWFLTNNYNTTTFAIVSHTGTTCTTISAGGNVSVGASGTNPDVDGKVNIWTDADGNLHVKNRMGSTRRFTAYDMSG